MVTLPSQLLAGRLTLAMYERMDIMDVVAKSPNDFVKIALQVRLIYCRLLVGYLQRIHVYRVNYCCDTSSSSYTVLYTVLYFLWKPQVGFSSFFLLV